MKDKLLYIALPAEPERKVRVNRSLVLELDIKNRERMKKHVWDQARKRGLLSSAKS